MPPRWTTKKQETWLGGRIPDYLEGKENQKGAKNFLDKMLELEVERAEEVQKAAMRLRLYNWFYNATQETKTVGSSDSILNLTPKRSGKLHDYQAYLKYKKDELTPIIRECYAAYLKETSTSDKANAFIKSQSDVAKKLLEEESDEVRVEVEVLREKADETPPLTVEQIKSAPRRLPRSLTIVLEEIEKQTGWKGSILVSRWHPTLNKYSTLIVHRGETQDGGESWPKFDGNYDLFQKSFQEFIPCCFVPFHNSDETRRPRMPLATTLGAAPGRITAPASTRRATGATSQASSKKKRKSGRAAQVSTSTPAPAPSAPASAQPPAGPVPAPVTSVQPPAQPAPAPMPAPAPLTSAQPPALTELASATRTPPAPPLGGTPALPLPDRSSLTSPFSADVRSTRVSESPAGVVAEQIGEETEQSQDEQDEQGDWEQHRRDNMAKLRAFHEELDKEFGHVTLVLELAGVRLLDILLASSLLSESHHCNDKSHACDDSARDTCESHHPDNTSHARDNGAHNNKSCARNNDTRNNSSLDNRESHQHNNESRICDNGTHNNSTRNNGTRNNGTRNNESHPRDNGTLNDATRTTSPTSTGQSSPSSINRVPTPPTDGNLPDWVALALPYLRESSSDSAWQEVVDIWLELDRKMHFQEKARLTAEHRPPAIGWWISRGRKYEACKMPAIDITEHSAAWQKWWTHLQPEWRQEQGEWPLSTTDSPEGCAVRDGWDSLLVAGPNGMFIPLISAAWWLRAMDSNDPNKAVVVAELRWVLDMLLIALARKRARSSSVVSEGERPSKRRKIAD
ncbi:hypothetical protein C8Q80DRAFT_1272367 [Daedaleopsis nitida]|nr:hypothetical protein C8Q80DRAFT_1272367 [Daedaleopsis nitida]